MAVRYYINLTNGLEFLEKTEQCNCAFIRIQSTACEQKRWGEILMDLDYTFLMDLALGNECFVIDYSQKKDMPRSLYQGLEWIKYALGRVWFDRHYKPCVKGHNCIAYFDTEFEKIKKGKAIMKLKYFKKFIKCTELKLHTITGRTKRDGDYEYYSKILEDSHLTR